MRAKYKLTVYLLLFAFLVSINACTMSEHTADTPEKIFSGKSDIDLNEDYTLDSISLKSKQTLKVRNYVAQFIENQKEKYLVYYYPFGISIDSALMKETNSKIPLYKSPVADTLNFKSIDSLHFTRTKFDTSYAILAFVIGIPVAFVFGGLLLFPKEKH